MSKRILPDEWLFSTVNVGFVGDFEVISGELCLVSRHGIVVRVGNVRIFYPWSTIATVEGA